MLCFTTIEDGLVQLVTDVVSPHSANVSLWVWDVSPNGVMRCLVTVFTIVLSFFLGMEAKKVKMVEFVRIWSVSVLWGDVAPIWKIRFFLRNLQSLTPFFL